MKHRTATPDLRPLYGAIAPGELLPLAVVKQRLRWGDQTISQAQRDGLRVLRYAKWGYIVGRDLIEFLERVGARADGGGRADEQTTEHR